MVPNEIMCTEFPVLRANVIWDRWYETRQLYLENIASIKKIQKLKLG